MSETGYTTTGYASHGGAHPEEPRSGVSKDSWQKGASVWEASPSQFKSTYDSPGWKRAQAAKDRDRPRPPDIEASPRLQASAASSEKGFKTGERIFHIKFGYGRITSVDGAKLTVAFEKAGEKKVVESFVERV